MKINIQDGTGAWSKSTCLSCVRDYSACDHRKIEKQAELEQRKLIKSVVANAREHRLMSICSQHELESDEFLTRFEKAKHYEN